MTPVQAMERVIHCLDRVHENGFKTKAFVRALDVIRSLPPEEVEARSRAGTLTQLSGIGDASARVVREALDGTNGYITKIENETQVPLSAGGAVYLDALRGDCHLHSTWSDGGAAIEAMARAAIEIGHDYIVLTDHSPRLTIAHGLNRERLEAQLVEIDRLNEELAPFRILRGMEVDILEDGGLDLDEDLLERLDVVVASVHSKLAMERPKMTERMVRAVASPHVDILGHCTGRLIGKRKQSTLRCRVRVRGVCAVRYGGRDQLPARATRPAGGAARTRHHHRLLVLDRLRCPCHWASSSSSRTGAIVPPMPTCRSTR